MPVVTMRDGQPLYVRVIGRGQPVLMLPGLGMSSRAWLPFLLPYLHRFRFHLPDFRGAGRSAATDLKPGDVFQAHMEDVQDVIAHFGLHDFLLAGISLGASTALHLQREGGFGGVRRYLHIDQSPCVGNREDWPHGLFGDRQDELFGKMREVLAVLAVHPDCVHFADLPLPAKRKAAATLAEVLALMGGSGGMQALIRRVLLLPKPFLGFMPMGRLADMRAYLSAYVAGGHDYRPSLSQGTTPVTVMAGMRSPLYASAGQAFVAAHLPASRLIRFERSGHVPFKDEPLKFARELGRFLNDRK